MAISNYSELQTGVDNFLKLNGDSSFTTRITEWIDLAEGEINRRLRVFRQEKTSIQTYTTTDTDRKVSMPSDFVEMRVVEVKKTSEADEEYREVRYVALDQFAGKVCETAGVPYHYTVKSNELEMDRLASESLQVRMIYIGQWDIATDSTNWLLTNYPDCYLYGACYHGALYRRDANVADICKGLFEKSLAQINMVDERTRDDAELDVTELGVVTQQRNRSYNIVTDTYNG